MQDRNPLFLPAAIFLATLIIGGAIFFVVIQNNDASRGGGRNSDSSDAAIVPPVSDRDHILGNPNAKVVIVEYSDFECQFCKEFHTTMHRLVDEYGKSGELAWVYRHFPLIQLHSKAPTEALASECVAELGGEQAFWNFADSVYRTTPSNDQLDLAQLPLLAEAAGVLRAEFDACMEDGALMARIETEFEEAVRAGGTGTPFSIIIVDDTQVPLEGAQPYVAMRSIVSAILKQTANEEALVPPSAGERYTLPKDEIPVSANTSSTTDERAGPGL